MTVSPRLVALSAEPVAVTVGMDLDVVGARAGMPAPGEPSSGYVLNTGGATLLFDCGPGVAGELPAAVPPAELDAVFVTHLHLDHCFDLLPLGKALLAPRVSYPAEGAPAALSGDVPPIPLYVPLGASAALRTLQDLFPVVSSPPLDRAFDLAFELREYVPGEPLAVGGSTVVPVPMRHAVRACGFRVAGPGGVFAFTGDTGWTDSLETLASEADLLLCEATLREPDSGSHGHLAATEAGRLAAAAGVGQLVLTHFSRTDADWLDLLRDDAASAYAGPIRLASAGARFTHRTDGEPTDRDRLRPTETGRGPTGRDLTDRDIARTT